MSRLEVFYERTVGLALAWPKSTLGIAFLLFALSFLLVPLIGTELLPEGDQSEVVVSLELPIGTRMEITEDAIKELEQVVADEVPEIVNMQTVVGTPGFWSTSGEESARISVKLLKPNERQRSSDEIAKALRPKVESRIPGANIRTRAGGGLWILRMLRGGGERLEVQIRGFDLKTADRLAGEVQEIVESVDGVSGARVSRREGGTEIQIRPDRTKIASMGLRYSDVGEQLQTYLQGTRATVLRDSGDEFDVLVRLREDERKGIEAMLDVPIVVPKIGTTPLRNLVQIEETEGPKTIERFNQARVVGVNAILTGDRDLGSITQDLRAKLSTVSRPDNFSLIVRGESEEQERTFQSLLIGILLALALVYMVMAAQFESFRQPLLIMASIPFAAVGVLAMLAATSTTFNIQSFMGCIVLAGIVVNNAIVLVDYINLMRRDYGMDVQEAVILSARRRLRPIMMTTTTTVLALVPVAIGFAEGGEAQAPLARAVIGGLISSGIISLILIPVLYNLVEGWSARRASASLE